MEDLYENKNPTLFSQTCDTSKGLFPDIDRKKALSVSGTCDNKIRKHGPTCKDPELGQFIDEVGGLALDLRLPKIKIDLPPFIPLLDSQTAQLSSFAIPSWATAVGLTIGDVILKGVTFKNGSWHEKEEVEYRMNLLTGNVFKDKKVILFMSGTDALIEMLWYRLDDIHLYEHLNAMGFHVSTGINFSVIKGECPVSQALNQKKSLASAYLSSKKGLPAMPHVYFIDNLDVKTWIKYFKKYPHIKVASLNCQLQESTIDKEVIVKGVSQIMMAIPDLHFILTGFPLPEIHKFGSLLTRIHIANKRASKSAQMHQKMVISPTTLKTKMVYCPDESVGDILSHNINQQGLYVEIVKKRTLEKYEIPREMWPLVRRFFPSDTSLDDPLDF